jgi:hypothetical protein
MREKIPTKECIKCNVMKPYSDFSPDKRASDGRVSSCKVCILKEKKLKKMQDIIVAFDYYE